VRLTPDELTQIATAPAELSTAELARRLGRNYTTVYTVRRRLQTTAVET
jgi:hypothetical protein